ncbi:MAG: lysophospholipid acyltransferase family protein [Candidatus Omnitrophica bacterium]|nr:lysophospholipid acyltransferase family protein [Candidatus Omnitrophota bacterium]
MSIEGAYSVVSFFTSAQYYVSKRDREIVKSNLRVALPDATEKDIARFAKNVFVNFGKYLVDFFSPLNENDDTLAKKTRFEGLENIDAALKQGKGCIIVTGHFGNWELCGCAMARRGYKINAVALDHNDPRINSLFIERRRRFGINVAPIGNAKNSCLAALGRNEIVAIVGDSPYGESGINVEFFGRTACIPRGPALFSMKTGAPIVVGFIYKEDENTADYKIIMEKPITVKNRVFLRKQLKDTMQYFIKRFECYIKKYPSQWYMFHRIWD